MPKGDEMEDVSLAGQAKGGSHFFIEGSSFWSLMTTIAMMIVFLAMHSYAAVRAPPILANKEDVFKLNSSEENVSIDVDLTLSSLRDFHKYVAVNASLVASVGVLDKTLAAQVSLRKTGLKNFAIVSNDSIEKRGVSVAFKQGKDESSSFFVDRSEVAGLDTLQLRMTMQTDFTGIVGFKFRWSFANPSAEKYARSAKLLMSFLVGYMLIVYVFYLKFDAEVFTQAVLLLVGGTGVIASNPVGLFFGDTALTKIADQVLMAAFVGIYRLLTLVEFEMLRTHELKPATWLTGVLIALLGATAVIDAFAGFDRAVHASDETQIALQGESLLLIVEFAYGVIGTCWCVAAFVGNAGQNMRRFGFFAFSFTCCTLCALGTRVFVPLKALYAYSGMAKMLFGSTHVTLAAVTLFLMHSGGGPEYSPVDADDGKHPVLDVDAESQVEEDGDDEDE